MKMASSIVSVQIKHVGLMMQNGSKLDFMDKLGFKTKRIISGLKSRQITCLFSHKSIEERFDNN